MNDLLLDKRNKKELKAEYNEKFIESFGVGSFQERRIWYLYAMNLHSVWLFCIGVNEKDGAMNMPETDLYLK